MENNGLFFVVVISSTVLIAFNVFFPLMIFFWLRSEQRKDYFELKGKIDKLR
jgi:cbb3-type cytochrome oxidase subunit 3